MKTLFEFNGSKQMSDSLPQHRNDVFHFVLKRKNRKKSGNMKDVIPSNSLFKTFNIVRFKFGSLNFETKSFDRRQNRFWTANKNFTVY